MNIKVMHDWYCYPLWYSYDEEKVGNINPYDLDISESLVNKLFNWSNNIDVKLNLNYPLDTRISRLDYLIHHITGLYLIYLLQKELSKDTVYYHLSVKEILLELIK